MKTIDCWNRKCWEKTPMNYDYFNAIFKKYIYIFISTHPVFKSITSYMIILSTKRFGVERKKEEPNPISFKKYLEACFTRIITCILLVNQSVYYRFFDIDVNIIRGRLRHQIQ